MRLKDSKTGKNLMVAFAGESQANMRYTLYADVARYEGLEQIAAVFEETAKNERAHAERLYKFLREDMGTGEMNIDHTYPVNYTKTPDNLISAYEGEMEETEHMYPDFATVADEEGFQVIAQTFRDIAVSERGHMKRFRKLYENIAEKEVFQKKEKVAWKCRNCGYIHTGTEAPVTCPACLKEQAYFEIQAENY